MRAQDQAAFLAALVAPQNSPQDLMPPCVHHPFNGDAQDRMAIYRNNYAFSLITVLGEAYPLLADLLGRDAFIALARDYVAAHPPVDPLMFQYGDKLPQFLTDYPDLAHVPYAGDLAALEKAINEAAHAADHIALPPQDLTDPQLAEEALQLAPSVRLIVSAWPLMDVFAYVSQQASQPVDAPHDMSLAQSVLVYRDAEYAVHPVLLPVGGDTLLAALMEGCSLVQAAETSALGEAGMVKVFSVLVQNGLIIGRHKISDWRE